MLYRNKASRPNTPANVIIGSLILKEMLGDTDDELLESLMFDVKYQYALYTTSHEENYYMLDHYNDIVEDLGNAEGIDFTKRLMTLGEIKKILVKTKK